MGMPNVAVYGGGPEAASALQALQIRSMLKQRRGKTEPWLDGRKPSLRVARANIHRCKIERWSSFIFASMEPLRPCGPGRRSDLLDVSLAGDEMVESTTDDPRVLGRGRHAQRFNPMLDTERHVVDVAGLDWQKKAQNRIAWPSLPSTMCHGVRGSN